MKFKLGLITMLWYRIWVINIIFNIGWGFFKSEQLGYFVTSTLVTTALTFVAFLIHGLYVLKTTTILEEPNILLKDHQEQLVKYIESKQGILEITPELNELLVKSGVAPAITIVNESNDIVGTFMDETILEWVQIKNPFTDEIETFTFHSCLPSGNPAELPEIEGKNFILLGHVIYEH